MVETLAPLAQTVTAKPYGRDPVSNEQFRALADSARSDERAREYFESLFPKLNSDPAELIDRLCQHPGIRSNTRGAGSDRATFVVRPSGGGRLELGILARFLTKSALHRGCPETVDRLEAFLSLSLEGRVPGYQVCIFRGLTLPGKVEIAPGLEMWDYQHAAAHGLVKPERPELVDNTSDYVGMNASVLAREMTWGPCLVPPLTSKDELPKAVPEFRWASGCSTGVVFDLLSVCTSHEVQVLFVTYSAPEFAEVYSGFVSGSGSGYFHGDNWSKKELVGEHVGQLKELLQLWSDFKADERETLELAVSRLSSSIFRNRGRFQIQDRILDAAIGLEIMYQLKPPELTNKLATRAAHLLATGTEERLKIFDHIHSFYDARSNIAHGDIGKRKGKGKKKSMGFKEAADLGFELASETLQTLLRNGEFPKWKELILSS